MKCYSTAANSKGATGKCEHVRSLRGPDDGLTSATKRHVRLDVMQRVGAFRFVSAKWKYKYRFQLPPQRAQAAFRRKKKVNLPNSNYKEHILGVCIIQNISVCVIQTQKWEFSFCFSFFFLFFWVGKRCCITVSGTGCRAWPTKLRG